MSAKISLARVHQLQTIKRRLTISGRVVVQYWGELGFRESEKKRKGKKLDLICTKDYGLEV